LLRGSASMEVETGIRLACGRAGSGLDHAAAVAEPPSIRRLTRATISAATAWRSG
jgi:hypothetical protein